MTPATSSPSAYEGTGPVDDESRADPALIRRGKLVGENLLPVLADRVFGARRCEADAEECLRGSNRERRMARCGIVGDHPTTAGRGIRLHVDLGFPRLVRGECDPLAIRRHASVFEKASVQESLYFGRVDIERPDVRTASTTCGISNRMLLVRRETH